MFTVIFYVLSLLGMTASRIHIGSNIARIRDLKGMKQETLAELLGTTQANVSRIEQSENVEEETLERVAKALGVSAETIKRYNGEILFNILNNVFHDQSQVGYFHQGNEKKIEALYDTLLKTEREKIAILEKYIAKLEGK